MAILLNGKEVSAKVQTRIAEEVQKLPIQPKLAVILVGEDPASQVYVNNKEKACAKCGFGSVKIILPADIGQEKLISTVTGLNADPTVHGILIQMPLPKGYGYDEATIQRTVLPEKDVDCFHPVNAGMLLLGQQAFQPCTPAGVMELLKDADISCEGKHVVIIGRSNIVGKPMAMLALQANATVTVCHSKTSDLPGITRQADILIAAVGRAKFVTADMVKPGAVVIDVGMNRPVGGKLCGDVDFDAVEPLVSAITPVPGGVGPMTIAMLMQNTLTAAKNTL
ncbi:MAG: bifunctional methylenetetrahydrofolate dehydrogenase/methenyltetrahydrofolate cyclohydrolase FolD [Oscillospiraceae bacterium]|jgi:methylenetetrahydrofolate dehydrogenase (NADP+)/methenyltetrahydrofolate cyclohydrolase|nr:bifunctional methylenetetrahydrofolate dehydrogenase/methenyltetrahydrofolate cyclohydrolase FolD [Oscillospiraceae bacterium]